MKKPMCILLACFVSGLIYAFPGGPKGSPVLNNPSIKRSEKDMNKQVSSFQNHKRYSSIVGSHGVAKASKKQEAKPTTGGKGL
jgi:hypothetical protein